MSIMTKEEFKKRWDNNEAIDMDEVIDCAKDWNVSQYPERENMTIVVNRVLVAAGCEEYFINTDEDEDYL